MKAAKALAIGCLAVLVASCVTVAPASTDPVYRFTNGQWFDGQGFAPRIFYSVDGRLMDRRSAGRAAQDVDLQGGFVVPPFGEAHNHNVESSSRIDEAIAGYLKAGVFYVSNPNSLPRAIVPLEGKVNVPTGIDAVFAQGGLTGPGGHPIGVVERNIARGTWSEADGEGAFYHTVDSVDELDAKWPRLLASRPGFVKTYLLYSEEYESRAGDEQYRYWRGLDPRLLPEIVERAHDAGLRVATHVETATDFRTALAAGVDEIAHLPGFRPDRDDLANFQNLGRYRLTEADAARAARQRVVLVTTIGDLLALLEETPADAQQATLAQQVRDLHAHNLRLLQEHGAHIAIGSDSYGDTSQQEMEALRRLGVFDNRALLDLWSRQTPQAIFPGRRIGELRGGYEASFLVLRRNPLETLSATKDIAMRVKQGHILPPLR